MNDIKYRILQRYAMNRQNLSRMLGMAQKADPAFVRLTVEGFVEQDPVK